MGVKLLKVEDDEEVSEYKLVNDNNDKITSYTVEHNKEKALISYETNAIFRNQGYASLGLNLLKDELFRNNKTLLLELIDLSGDYSRKVAENAGFFSPANNLDRFITLHPFAENIVEQRMLSCEKESTQYDKLAKLLERLRNIRRQQEAAQKN